MEELDEGTRLFLFLPSKRASDDVLRRSELWKDERNRLDQSNSFIGTVAYGHV